MRPADMAEAAAMLRQVLAQVDRGDLSDGGPQGSKLLRRLEGAAAALEVAGGVAPREGHERASAEPS